MDRDSPIRALCDAHAIPVILYLDENGPRTKTEIYSAVGRNANMPDKLRRPRGADPPGDRRHDGRRLRPKSLTPV